MPIVSCITAFKHMQSLISMKKLLLKAYKIFFIFPTCKRSCKLIKKIGLYILMITELKVACVFLLGGWGCSFLVIWREFKQFSPLSCWWPVYECMQWH